MKNNLLGLDIGGTKCAVIYGVSDGDSIGIVDKEVFSTTRAPQTIDNLLAAASSMMARHGLDQSNTAAAGISCGGPLDSASGVVMSPPNLPDWNDVPIVEIVSSHLGIPASIQNDANACALAEWKFGAGRGTRNMVFLTFGTGLGAGLILDGRLYTGTNDNAGEVGHVRLADFGPVGYGKSGSFEGFCSGGGIAQLARDRALEQIQSGRRVAWCPDGDVNGITAKQVAEAALAGDPLALEVYRTSAEYMGRGLAMIVDIVNPEVIVLGGIYTRNERMMKPVIEETLRREALGVASCVCTVKAAELGENVGDYAALSVAADLTGRRL